METERYSYFPAELVSTCFYHRLREGAGDWRGDETRGQERRREEKEIERCDDDPLATEATGISKAGHKGHYVILTTF